MINATPDPSPIIRLWRRYRAWRLRRDHMPPLSDATMRWIDKQ